MFMGFLTELALYPEHVHLLDQVIYLALHVLKHLHLALFFGCALSLQYVLLLIFLLWLSYYLNTGWPQFPFFLNSDPLFFLSNQFLFYDQVLYDKFVELVVLRGIQAFDLLKDLGTEGAKHSELLLALCLGGEKLGESLGEKEGSVIRGIQRRGIA
ncbi:hypothetical protein FGO68_gene8161 [Halteria grandinella]|uniref:Uncharacterized protein n=1 Tax=Halteria grandinella TaxID=5974 RepID=A0A8J8NYI1_HALGN|nr:hypothetical protein FGO68_gene8161 [Halteria grandinella]